MDFTLLAFLVAIPAAAGALLLPLLWDVKACLEGREERVCLWRWWLLYFLGLASLISAVAGVCAALLFWIDLPPSRPFHLHTYCRVLARDVDLKSAKLCSFWRPPGREGGDARPKWRAEMRCYFEYYWASVFEVELWPRASLMPVLAAAEEPSSLLPTRCRPDFNHAWNNREKYEINATYPCKYNPLDLRLVDMAGKASSGSGDCRVDSLFHNELPMQLLIHLVYSESSLFSMSTDNGRLYLGALAGVALGLFHVAVGTCSALWVRQGRPPTFKQPKAEIEHLLLFARVQGFWLLVGMVLAASRFGFCYQEDIAMFIDHMLFRICAAVGCYDS